MKKEIIEQCIELLNQALNEENETWIDPDTGLEWEVEGTTCAMDWPLAQEYARNLRKGGYSDWRVPTRRELLTLVDDTKYKPCIKTNSLRCYSAHYWTATTLASGKGSAWHVDFNNGHVSSFYKADRYYVRCVRGSREPVI